MLNNFVGLALKGLSTSNFLFDMHIHILQNSSPNGFALVIVMSEALQQLEIKIMPKDLTFNSVYKRGAFRTQSNIYDKKTVPS